MKRYHLFVLVSYVIMKLSRDTAVSAFAHWKSRRLCSSSHTSYIRENRYSPPYPSCINTVIHLFRDQDQTQVLPNRTSFFPSFISLPRFLLSKKNNDNNTSTTTITTIREGGKSIVEKVGGILFRYNTKSQPPYNNTTNDSLSSTDKTSSSSSRIVGYISRFFQYMVSSPKSSGERIFDSEVQLSQTFGNISASLTSSSSASISSPSSSLLYVSQQESKTKIKSEQSTTSYTASPGSSNTNYLMDLFFAIPYWVKDSFDSLTLSMRNNRDEEWIVVCPKNQVSPGAIVPVVIAGGINLLIIASKDGKRVYCVANSCPHLGTPLETGIVEQRPITSTSYSTIQGNVGSFHRSSTTTTTIIKKRKSLSTGGMVSSPTVLNSTDVDGMSEACIVCPLHRTAFALESGEVRGPWCPYPPILGAMVGLVKPITKLPTFAIRTRGKNIEVLINSRINDKMNEIDE